MPQHPLSLRTPLAAILLSLVAGSAMVALAQEPLRIDMAQQSPQQGRRGAGRSAAAQADSAPRPSGPMAPDRIGGRVVSAVDGHGIPNASVTLQDDATGRNTGNTAVAAVRTDAEGRYRFPPQRVGKYSLHATASGYLSTAYQAHEGFSTAIVLGAGLATDALQFTLTPSAIIAGRVLDENGDAVQHAQITLYRENANSPTAAPDAEDGATGQIQRTRNSITNDDGTFEFAGVAPGRFYLSANGSPWYATHARTDPENGSLPYRTNVDPALDVAYPELFYPSSTESTGASPINIKGGERITANFVMQPEHALSLTIHMPTGDGPNRAFPQLTRTVFGISEPVRVQSGGSSGRDMVLSGIAPGHYRLQSFSPNNRMPVDGGEVDLSSASTVIEMPTADAGALATIHATLHDVSGAALPTEMQLNLRSAAAGPPRGGNLSQHMKDSNEALLANVPPGDYRFNLFTSGKALNVVGLTVDGKKTADTRLHVAGKGDMAVDLQVTAYAPALEGFAQRDGKGFAGAMVVLVPAGADGSSELFRRDQSDLDGSFRLNNVVPGNYLLVAVDDGWKLLKWNDAAALTPYLANATPVVVSGNGGTTVHLKDSVAAQPR